MFLAVDPGLTGALVLKGEGVFMAWPMPTYAKKAGARNARRKFIYEPGVFEIVHQAALMGADTLVIEQVSGLPGQSASTAFTFGYGVGIVTAAGIACDLIIERVTPQTWKGKLRVPRDKTAARARASELMPERAGQWPRACDDGIAEAAMLALYAERHL
jgi:hypothetical protein